MKYKTSDQAIIRQCYDGTEHLTLCSLIGDGVWHEATFYLSSQYYDDFTPEGALNVRLEVMQTGVYIDWINMSIDSDADGLIDEIEADIGTNIYSADSDNDNLRDGTEQAIGTDPLDADTDEDGLMDGGERYSYSWSTDVFYQIPDDGTVGDPATATLSLPAIIGDIEHVWVQVGIVHPSCADVTVSIQKDSSVRKALASQPEGPKGAYYDCWDLLTMGYTESDFEKTTTWTLRVDDVRSGNQGRIEYFKVLVEGNTDPLKADSDSDGILDGEEVDLGKDGWMTNPMSPDSDGDGLIDRQEIEGFGKGGVKIRTDPTRADTDGDGYSDKADICPLGDAIIKVDLLNFKLYDTLCQIFGMGGSSSPETFFVLQSGDVTYSTDRFESQKGEWRDPNMQYYFDICDSTSTITIDVQAWADNVDMGSGDLHLDIGTQGNNGWDYRIVYDALSKDPTPYYCDGKASGDGGDGRDGYLVLSVAMVTLPRVNTIVVNGTDYGLDAYGSEYRYSADDQVYMFYLNCSSAGGAFVKGLNTVIVPRAVLLESSLNYTLFHPETVGSGHVLNGASFSITDANEEQASSHIIAVISKNVTASDANTILRMLTHDTGGEVIGNAVSVSSAQLLLMHLPLDVLNYVPLTGLQSSPTGDAPKELLGVIFGTVMSAVDFLVNSIIDLGTFMLDVLVTIAEAVLAFYAGLVQAAADAVRAVVDVIVDAFLAFVDWVIEFATSVFNSLIAPFIDYISDAMHSVYASIKSASISIIADLEGGAQASSGSINEMSRALFGDLLFWIVGISVVVNLAIFAMRGMTLGAGFLISICLTVMAGLVVTNIIGMAAGSYDGSAPQDGTNGVITNWIESIFLQAGKSPTDADQVVGYLNSFWCVIELIPAMVLMEAVPGFTAGIGLAVTIFSIIIGFYAIADHDARLSAVGLVLGVIGALESLFGEAIQALSSELIIFTRLISLISIGFITINLIWTVI